MEQFKFYVFEVIVDNQTRWATSKESGYLLDAEIWNPPPKFNLQDFKGKKSRQLQESTQDPTTPIEDSDLFELLESLNLTDEEKKEELTIFHKIKLAGKVRDFDFKTFIISSPPVI